MSRGGGGDVGPAPKQNIVFLTYDSTSPAYEPCRKVARMIHTDASLEYVTLVVDAAQVDPMTMRSMNITELPAVVSEQPDISPELMREYVRIMTTDTSKQEERAKFYGILGVPKMKYVMYTGANAIMYLSTKVNQEVSIPRSTGFSKRATSHAYKNVMVYDDRKNELNPHMIPAGRFSMAFDAMRPNDDSYWASQMESVAERREAWSEVDKWKMIQ